MKKLKISFISLTLVFVLVLNGYSQSFWEWSDPFSLTDSTSDNSNAFLYLAYSDAVFMFWEKAVDSTTTELWMNNMGDGLPPQVVLSDAGVQYTHSKIISTHYYPYPDSVFYVLYQTNQNGNQDIYYIVYLPDGSFTDPNAITTEAGDDTQLTVGRDMFNDASQTELTVIAWINNDQLFAATLISDNGQFFSEPVLVDSAYSTAPSSCLEGGFYGQPRGILYEKADTSGPYIYQSVYEGNGVWGSPEVVYDSTIAKNPTRMAYYGEECWTAYIDTVWRVMIKEWDGSNVLFDIAKPDPFDPAVLGMVLGVDEWEMSWVAVTYPEDGKDEIYMRDLNWPSEFKNFTNSGTMNRNPKFYMGESYSYGCWFDYLVWESYRNGHWQIWGSKVLQCMGNVDDEPDKESYISVHPNPFSNETTLEFTLENRAHLVIDVYDNGGMLVATIVDQIYDQGEHQLRWNADGLPAGVYIIKMAVGGKTYSTKLIKSP